MDDLNVFEYAQKHNLADKFADRCINIDEIDAVILCLSIIDDERDSYYYALAHKPKDPTGRQKTLSNLLTEAKNQQAKDDILMEWSAVYHWRSAVKDVKYNILDSCMAILEDTGMGNKRKELLLPRFTEYLFQPE